MVDLLAAHSQHSSFLEEAGDVFPSQLSLQLEHITQYWPMEP